MLLGNHYQIQWYKHYQSFEFVPYHSDAKIGTLITDYMLYLAFIVIIKYKIQTEESLKEYIDSVPEEYRKISNNYNKRN